MKSIWFAAFALLAVLAAAQTDSGVCRLLPDTVIARTQGSKPVTTRATSSDTGKLQSSQCFFELAPFTQSVSLQVISHSGKDQIDVRNFWNTRFHGKKTDADGDEDRDEAKAGRNESEEHERQKPPVAVKGLGDEAFWVDTGRDGALYALSGEHIVRLSLGGNLPRARKMANATVLARAVLSNLSAATSARSK